MKNHTQHTPKIYTDADRAEALGGMLTLMAAFLGICLISVALCRIFSK